MTMPHRLVSKIPAGPLHGAVTYPPREANVPEFSKAAYASMW